MMGQDWPSDYIFYSLSCVPCIINIIIIYKSHRIYTHLTLHAVYIKAPLKALLQIHEEKSYQIGYESSICCSRKRGFFSSVEWLNS